MEGGMAKRVRVKGHLGVYERKTSKGIALDIAYNTPDGKLKWEVAGFRHDGVSTKDAAALRAKRLWDQKLGYAQPETKALTFGQAYDKYKAMERLKAETLSNKDNIYSKHFGGLVKLKLSEITPVMVKMLIKEWQTAGAMDSTVKNRLRFLSAVIGSMIRVDLYKGTNPVSKIRFVANAPGKMRHLEWDEWTRLLEHLRSRTNSEAYAQAALALLHGARHIECVRLMPEDIDFENNRITLRGKGTIRAAEIPRTVPLSTLMKEILLTIPMVAGTPVFKTDARIAIRNAINRLGFNDGIPEKAPNRCTFHSLRHTYITSMVAVSGDLYTISKMAGHSTTRMTEHYTHLMRGKMEAAQEIANTKLVELGMVTEAQQV